MILDKAKMAHEWAVKHGKSDTIGDRLNMVRYAWGYADAMQAEADKRVVKLPDVFFDAKQNEEWQPDWSQAPENMTHWGMELGSAYWLKEEGNGLFCKIGKASLFGYTGNQQGSLRKRPQ